MKNPAVSVLMTVYKDMDYLEEAVRSILDQTYKNFEFIIIAEPETPSETLGIIRAFHDKRICLIINRKHLGFSDSLNKGIRISRGKYIARMDADDISLPNRLLCQLVYMEMHPKVIMCGTNAFSIDQNGRILNRTNLPINAAEIKTRLYFQNVILHPTVMLRKDKFIRSRFFYKAQQAEDYELWTRVCLLHNIVNLKSILFKRRLHGNNTIRRYKDEIRWNDLNTQKALWEKTGITVDISKPFYDNEKLTSNERRKRKVYIDKLEDKTPYFLGKQRLFKEIRKEKEQRL